MLERVELKRKTDGSVYVEISPRFLGTLFARKVYVVPEDTVLCIPPSGFHVHPTRDILIPIQGSVVLRYVGKHGRLHADKLEVGNLYSLPPGVPHRVEISNGVLESYFPSIIWDGKLPVWQEGDSSVTGGDRHVHENHDGLSSD